MEDEPELDDEQQWYLSCFMFLSRFRPPSMGSTPSPIPLSEILDYMERVLQVHDRDDAERFVYLITEMDEAYCNWRSENS